MRDDDEWAYFCREARPTLEAVSAAAAAAPQALQPLFGKIRESLFDADFTVAALQRELGLTDDVLWVDFHRVTGMSVARYVQHARLETAARLLRNTPLSAESVAWLVGYSDARALRRAFKKWSGYGPEAYSKMMALALAIDRRAAAYAAKTGTELKKSSPDGNNDVFLGWTLMRRQQLARRYELATLDDVRRFAYRLARLASASGPHTIQLRYRDGLLTMTVSPARGEELTADQYRLIASVDVWHRKTFGARESYSDAETSGT